eukprot:scaffold433_cov260-Chaetoceros_neogracile.AAC.62
MSLVFTLPPSSPSSRRNSIYIGGKEDAKDRSKLEQWGVKYVLNMTPEKDSSIQSGVANYFEKKKVFAYKRISVYDASTTDLLSYAPQIVSFISKGLNYGSVLVHCQRGVSRSTTAVLFYLMYAQGIELQSALKLDYEKECKDEGLICESSTEDLPDESIRRKRKGIGPSIGPSREPSTSKQRIVGPSLPLQVQPNAIAAMVKAQESENGSNGGSFAKVDVNLNESTSTSTSARKRTEIGPSIAPSRESSPSK